MATDTSHYPSPDARVTPPGPERQIGVLLVDDHPAVRLGARGLIDSQPDMTVVAQASNADDALQQITQAIDVAIVDYHLGQGEDGLWLTTQLKRSETSPRVLIYSAFADTALAGMALIAGADGLIGKHELGAELCWAIRRLARGQHNLPAVSPTVAHAMRSRLQPRDQAIFGMLLHGMASEAVAERLSITPEELDARRVLMLGRFRPAWPPSVLPVGARAPLDYARAGRATTHRRAA
ncbi:MAG: response regulator, partial [Solirubrobacteraceae bacterium]